MYVGTLASIPFGRMGEPEEVGEVIAAVCSRLLDHRPNHLHRRWSKPLAQAGPNIAQISGVCAVATASAWVCASCNQYTLVAPGFCPGLQAFEHHL